MAPEDRRCPFPVSCRKPGRSWGSVCKNAIILCSLAEVESETIPFERDSVRRYLERHIAFWSAKVEKHGEGYAVQYRDAYGKLLRDLFGKGSEAVNDS